MWNNEEILKRQQLAISWLQKKNQEAKTSGLICGISGGVDSAVVAGLCKKAFPEASLGVIMPCNSNPEDKEDALLTAETLGLEVVEIDLKIAHESISKQLESIMPMEEIPLKVKQLGQGNLKARLRMSTLYAIANLKNYLVVGTDNAPESYTGYFTKYGDGGVDLLPLSSLTKAEVRVWAKVLGLPEAIVTRIPTAGLWQGQTDETEMGLSYDIIDRYLIGEEVSPQAVEKIEKLHAVSHHKRQMPATLDLPILERLV